MSPSDVYMDADAPDLVLSDRTVLELARAHVPTAAAVTGVDESGGEARVYFVDRDVVVKTQRPPRRRARTDLAKEALLLGQLAHRLPGQVPALLGYGHVQTPEGAVQYLCMTRVAGRAAVHQPGPVRSHVLRRLGEVLAVVHTTEFDAAAALIPADLDASDVRARLEGGFTAVAERLAGCPEAPALPVPVERITDRALSALPTAFTGVMPVLHSNPGPTHTFVTDDGDFGALIDFGDAYRSHPALDLVRWPRPADRRALRDGYRHARDCGADFDAVWTGAMVLADLDVLARGGPLAAEVLQDLTARLRQL
jgi:hygromycin-B 7''-O-kinase